MRDRLSSIRTDEQFTSEQMLRIAVERLADPHDHVVIPTLIPERDPNEHVRERGVESHSETRLARGRAAAHRALPSSP